MTHHRRVPVALVWVFVLILVLGAALASGCSDAMSATPATSSEPQRGGPRQLGAVAGKSFIPRDRFTEGNFGQESAESLRDKYGFTVGFPETAGGGVLEGVYEPEPLGAMRAWAGVYTSDVVVEIIMMPSETDAVEWIASDRGEPYATFVTTHTVGKNTVCARPKLEGSPIKDPKSGETTGRVSTSTGRVFWVQGRFVLQVLHPDLSVADLLTVAGDVRFDPQGTLKP